jgi:hypothetical protein
MSTLFTQALARNLLFPICLVGHEILRDITKSMIFCEYSHAVWRQPHVPPKDQALTGLHGNTNQRTIPFVTRVSKRNSSLILKIFS